jgi:RNA polymerase sigma factor (TIGR02999 family)
LAWREGDEAALARLTLLVHQELRRIARRCMRGERAGHSLQATALVNEAYLRLFDVQHVNWRDRAHFMAMAARMMRRILVEFARAKVREKRGGGWVRVSLGEDVVTTDKGRDLVALDDALGALAQLDQRKSHVVELRFFGGLSVEETAEALSVSPQTVMRDWKFSRAWLMSELGRDTTAIQKRGS